MRILRKFKTVRKSVSSKVDDFFVRLGGVAFSTASIYYLVKGKFSREHRAVLAGRRAYVRSLQNPKNNSSLLRRNIHRLEKGLLMRPRRVPFELDYIGETMTIYELAIQARIESTELAWAGDVLSEYFRITPEHPIIEPLRRRFQKQEEVFSESASAVDKRIPYARDVQDLPRIEYSELLKLARYRRSVRWYLPYKVPRDMIEKAIAVAAYSPSACNRHPYEFRVFDTPELVREIIQFPMGTSGFHQQVPAVAVVVGKLRNYPHERDRHLIYTDGALAIMSFVYALEVQGLSSCCINWPDIEDREKKMANFLKLALDERPIMLVSFGYPDPNGLVANSTKKPVSTLCQYNFEANETPDH